MSRQSRPIQQSQNRQNRIDSGGTETTDPDNTGETDNTEGFTEEPVTDTTDNTVPQTPQYRKEGRRMASNIFHGLLSIYQDIDLALTEHQVPPVVHVKQFDHRSRKVRCTLYQGAAEYQIPDGAVLTYSGTRPDGQLFHYTSEALENDKVGIVDNGWSSR